KLSQNNDDCYVHTMGRGGRSQGADWRGTAPWHTQQHHQQGGWQRRVPSKPRQRQSSQKRRGEYLVCPYCPPGESWVYTKRAGTPGWEGCKTCTYTWPKPADLNDKDKLAAKQALATLGLDDDSLRAIQAVVKSAKTSGDTQAAQAAETLAKLPVLAPAPEGPANPEPKLGVRLEAAALRWRQAQQAQEKVTGQLAQLDKRRQELFVKLDETTDEQQQATEDQWGDLPELSEEDLELLDPEAKTKYAQAAALARQAKEVYSAAKDQSTSIKEVADTLRKLQAKVTAKKRRRVGDGEGEATEEAKVEVKEEAAGATTDPAKCDFSNADDAKKYLDQTTAIRVLALTLALLGALVKEAGAGDPRSHPSLASTHNTLTAAARPAESQPTTDDLGNSVAIATEFLRWCEGRRLLPTPEPNGNQAASWRLPRGSGSSTQADSLSVESVSTPSQAMANQASALDTKRGQAARQTSPHQRPYPGEHPQDADEPVHGRLGRVPSAGSWEPLIEREAVQVFFGNCSQYNDAAKAFVEGAQCFDLIGFAEQHLTRPQCDAEEQRLRRYGWRSMRSWTPATSSRRAAVRPGQAERREGPHGGTCWLRRNDLNTFSHLPDKTGKGAFHDRLSDATVTLIRRRHGTFALIGCYLDCSIGLVGNSGAKLGNILRVTRSLGVPWIIVGDFNCAPDEMASSRWPQALKCKILAPDADLTCASGKGRVLDYLLRFETPTVETQITKGIKRAQRDRQQYEKAVEEGLDDDEFANLQHLTSDTYTKKHHAFCADDAWTNAKDYAAHCQLGEPPPWVQSSLAYRANPDSAGSLGERYGYWAMAAEKTLADLCEVKPRNNARRGQPIKYAWTAATSLLKHQRGHQGAARRPEVNMWGTLQGRLTELRNVCLKTNGASGQRAAIEHVIILTCQLIRDAQKLMEDDPSEDSRALRCAEALVRGQRLPVPDDEQDEWVTTVEAVRQRADSHNKKAWQETRSAVRHSTEQALQGSMGEGHRHLSKPERKDLSEVTIDPLDGHPEGDLQDLQAVMEGLRAKADAANRNRRPCELADLDKAVRQFKKTTGRGTDQWSPAELAALPTPARQELTDLINDCEATLSWPHQFYHMWYQLLRQNDSAVAGEGRPTGLFPILARAWGRLTKHEVGQWCDERAAFWDAAVTGSSALQAFIVAASRDEAAARGQSAEAWASLFLDFEKFYDSINLVKLTKKADALEYQPVELYLCTLMYVAPRVVRASGAYGAPLVPCNSIVAGCNHASNAARMMLYDILELAHRTAPKTWPRQYVDDAQIRAHPDQLPISGKSALVASHPAVRDAVGATAAAMGLTLTQADIMKDLGCDTTIGRRPASLHRTNIRANQQHDQAATGMTPHDIVRARAEAADMAGITAGHRCTATVFILTHGDKEPWTANVTRQLREWVRMWRRNDDLRDHLREAWHRVQIHLNSATKRGRWMAATGPMAARQLSLEVLGWKGQEADQWTDHRGHMWQISDAVDANLTEVEEAIKDAATSLLWSQASRHPEGQGLQRGADISALQSSASLFRKLERHQEAGALEASACAAIWTNHKCHAAGCHTQPTCTRCQLGVDDTPFHRLYECPATDDIDDQWVTSTVALVARARAVKDDPLEHAFWVRGILPNDMCPIDPPPEWGSPGDTHWAVGNFGKRTGDTRSVAAAAAYTDSSVTSGGKRIARAGWGISLELPEDTGTNIDDYPGWFGILDGPQTVAAAELAAIYWTLKLTHGPLTIVTDSQTVADGWRSYSCARPEGPLARWWQRIQDAIREREGGIRDLTVIKCYSHIDVITIQQIRQPMRVTRGNELADGYAQRGAEIAAN
ncbi:unnamed protein product, partial [Prorocentrum cordatum]